MMTREQRRAEELKITRMGLAALAMLLLIVSAALHTATRSVTDARETNTLLTERVAALETDLRETRQNLRMAQAALLLRDEPSEPVTEAAIPEAAKAKCVNALARLCGAEGMIGGQQIDTVNVGSDLSGDTLMSMYSMKTSALIKAACLCGVYCAQSGEEERYVCGAAEYAEYLGLAFQIIDDILDVTGSTEVLGKQTGNDAENDKHTFVRIYGLAKAETAAREYTEKAMKALGCFKDNEFVKRLTQTLLGRKK